MPLRTDRDVARFYHADLSNLSPIELFAERVQLTDRLTWCVFARRRDRVIWHDGCRLVTAQGWLRERLAQLEAEERRRRAA